MKFIWKTKQNYLVQIVIIYNKLFFTLRSTDNIGFVIFKAGIIDFLDESELFSMVYCYVIKKTFDQFNCKIGFFNDKKFTSGFTILLFLYVCHCSSYVMYPNIIKHYNVGV
jgi:hypothetical protein